MDIKIFLSYAREDKALADVLVRHLGKHKLIVWYDNYLHLGEDWKKKLISKLERANIILFLVSPDFISSDFCCETEVPLAMERFSQGEAHVIPIVARDTFWKE